MNGQIRVQARVEGLVQGVGFRPFVHHLATGLGLAGVVGNTGGEVLVEVEGDQHSVDEFLARLRREHPPLALIAQLTVDQLPPTGSTGFEIAPSQPGQRQQAPIPPDVATCPDCLREVADPRDRRHRHPFNSCTNCGPRFTIITDLPYDRPQTTMAGFSMCQHCQREYEDPADRRFHAQPVCCPACGPQLVLTDPAGTPLATDPAGTPLPDDPIAAAAVLLRAGLVLAVKGLGGYHLAADATSEPAVAALRARKHRDDKPFALLVADLATAGELVRLTPADAQLLTSPARPIVLALRHDRQAVAGSVAPHCDRLGVLLPYTPLHQLLLAAMPGPLVLTSGNRCDEPIAFRDDAALRQLAGIADGFLRHNRPIHVRTDDSIATTFAGRPLLLRRSRGYVPQPIRLPGPAPRPVLGCGAELKNTFCLAAGEQAYLSHHIGDLTNYQTLRSYTEGIGQLRRLLDLTPQLIAYDLHPEYLSSKFAHELPQAELPGVELVGVQHHHAHIAACLVDNHEAGPVIGVALDGLGYGLDGTLWGGELLVADLAGFRRAGHLDPVPMPGGVSAIRQPWRMAVSYLAAAFDGEPPADLPLLRRHAGQWQRVHTLAGSGAGAAPLTSSAGRLFDAVAALLGVRDQISYEGQAAIELEQLADPTERAAYPARIESPGQRAPLRLAGADLVRAAAEELAGGVPVPTISARFHNGLATMVVTACRRLRETDGLQTVALSGGGFQNLRLLTDTVQLLAAAGFRVLTHSRVPPNDGGISLGQVAVAAARDRLAAG